MESKMDELKQVNEKIERTTKNIETGIVQLQIPPKNWSRHI